MKSKRLLATMLAATMTLSMLQTAAFAAEGDEVTTPGEGQETTTQLPVTIDDTGEGDGTGETPITPQPNAPTTEPTDNTVATIGEGEELKQFETLDEAINSSDGEVVIDLTKNAEITVGTITHPVVINGNGLTVTVPSQNTDSHGLQIYNSLTFNNTNVQFANEKTFVQGGETKGWSAVMNSAGRLNLNNSTCSFKLSGMYVDFNAQINLDSSTMTLDQMSYTCMMGDSESVETLPQLNITNESTFAITKALGINGITSFDITVDNSSFSVTNCPRQGLVRCNLTLTNSAVADISDNYTGYNLYGGNALTINDGTSLTMKRNLSRAIMTQGNDATTVTVKPGGTLTVQENGEAWKQSDDESKYYPSKGAITIGVYGYSSSSNYIFLYRNDILTFEDGAHVDISNNYVRGLTNFGTAYLGSGTQIINNGMLSEGQTEADRRVATGGGIYNANTLTINPSTPVYNNHANEKADDIYNRGDGTLTFAEVGSNWYLDGEPDCTHKITGWFLDGSAKDESGNRIRWNAHPSEGETAYVEEYSLADSGSTITKTTASLKAAHGLTGVVTGVVFNDTTRDDIYANGEEVFSGVTVTLVNASGNTVATTTTDANGRYTFEDVPAGTYTVQVSARPDGVNRDCSVSEAAQGNKFTSNAATVTVVVGETATANAGYYYHRSSGGGGNGGGSTTPIPEEDVPLAPGLNDDDHFAYIIGYPMDYQTGEATEDKNRWPVRPEASIDREEVATIFFRLLEDDSRIEYWSQSNAYSDVTSAKWSNNAISTMSNAGIVNGYTDGTFGPDKAITRAEFAAIAARFDSALYEGEDQFSDISGHWAAEYINRAAQKGWINGYPDGTFKPDQPITRAEAMTLVNNVLNRHTDADNMLDDMIKWPDNAASAWYYEAVQEATNGHDYERIDDSTEKWTQMQAVRDWAALEKSWSTAAANAQA